MKLGPLREKKKMSCHEVQSQQLPVKNIVLAFGVSEHMTEKGELLPDARVPLLQHGAHCYMRTLTVVNAISTDGNSWAALASADFAAEKAWMRSGDQSTGS